MAYGKSILSTIPADWVVTNGELTSSTMTLHANGSALLNITIDMIDKLPETAEVTVVAGTYSINNRVEVIAVLQDNTYVAHTLPIVDVGNGIYKTIIDFPEEAYSSFIFKISSKEGVDITEWSMATPVSADFTEVIDGVKQEIPKLLWDYNTLEFQIGQEECTVGMISAKLSKNGDLQGHLQINFTASENSVAVIRIFDNEIQELYSPIEYAVKRGRNSIGIPHAYLKRKIGIHNFLVTMQTSTGTLTVETRGLLYTIDGGYLATRIVDVGYELSDLTIKQLPTEQKPSEIYAVCIDDGKALIRKRILNEEVALAWEPVYIIEDAVQACIEFHGLWILRDMEVGFTLETEEVPFVVWRDAANTLWSQRGPDVTTKFQMATGVTDLSLCMSYNYAPEIQYDQGLVCAYIKAGLVYYKNMCRQNLLGTLVWGAERPIGLLGSGNTDVMVARLNDYRVAISATNSKSQWLISQRGYVGQAIRPERLNLTLKSLTMLPVNYITLTTTELTAPDESMELSLQGHQEPLNVSWQNTTTPIVTDFSVIETGWASTKSIRISCNLPLVLYAHYVDNFRAYSMSRKMTVTGVTLENPTTLIITILETPEPLEAVTIVVRGTPAMQYLASAENRRFVPALECTALSPALDKKEYLPIALKSTILQPIGYTAITSSNKTAPNESMTFKLKGVSIGTITYTQYGTSPI